MLKKTVIAKKIGMTQVYHQGEMVAATVLHVEQCKVRRILSGGIEIATGDVAGRWVSRTVAGDGVVGELQDLAFVSSAKWLDVIGTSKGRGYSGVIRKHGFSGLGASHGVKKVHRSGGSPPCTGRSSRSWAWHGAGPNPATGAVAPPSSKPEVGPS